MTRLTDHQVCAKIRREGKRHKGRKGLSRMAADMFRLDEFDKNNPVLQFWPQTTRVQEVALCVRMTDYAVAAGMVWC